MNSAAYQFCAAPAKALHSPNFLRIIWAKKQLYVDLLSEGTLLLMLNNTDSASLEG